MKKNYSFYIGKRQIDAMVTSHCSRQQFDDFVCSEIEKAIQDNKRSFELPINRSIVTVNIELFQGMVNTLLVSLRPRLR